MQSPFAPSHLALLASTQWAWIGCAATGAKIPFAPLQISQGSEGHVRFPSPGPSPGCSSCDFSRSQPLFCPLQLWPSRCIVIHAPHAGRQALAEYVLLFLPTQPGLENML
ncbi:hypothetical protein CDEST_05026 [Colletotrichum destructivum]|uniref:Secreted protein n=1 Tax=Colletotrichum destructivum TaxID=34406 RepID=A0AAX4I9Y4_9PEZI|nr:hypothetical protein CDEST_05026 [Colletotrichum destructivum]